MEALTAIIAKGMELGVLCSYRGITAAQRISIYADDVALFIRPTRLDLHFVREALYAFGEVSGLRVNYKKSTATIIRGELEDRARVGDLLQCSLTEFPCRYLGL